MKLPELLPGDCLLYNADTLLDLAIRVKTWSPVAHVEVYIGDGLSVASRNGVGVNKYALRKQGITYVLRPNQAFDQAAALKWFYSNAKGERYDWLGLLCFTLAVAQGSPNKMFCSEFALRYYRAGGLNPLHPQWDADKTAPGNFLMSPAFDWIYSPEKK